MYSMFQNLKYPLLFFINKYVTRFRVYSKTYKPWVGEPCTSSASRNWHIDSMVKNWRLGIFNKTLATIYSSPWLQPPLVNESTRIVGYGQPCMHVFFEETRSWNYIYDIYSSWKTTHWVDRVICLNMIYIRLIFFHASGGLYWLILLSEYCLGKRFIHALLFPLHLCV